MNVRFTQKDYEELPFREDVTTGYLNGIYYRSKAYRNTVFRFVGTEHRPEWWAFSALIRGAS